MCCKINMPYKTNSLAVFIPAVTSLCITICLFFLQHIVGLNASPGMGGMLVAIPYLLFIVSVPITLITLIVTIIKRNRQRTHVEQSPTALTEKKIDSH